jgi:membrane protein
VRVRAAQVWALVRDAVTAWIEDGATSMGAALAYYTLFSIAPLLLISISLAGLLFGAEAARGEVIGQLSSLVGEQSARTIESMLVELNRPGAGVAGAVIGGITLLIGATTVFAELQAALDRIWRAPALVPTGTSALSAIWDWLRTRLLSLGMILGIGFLLLVSLVASAALSAVGKWVQGWSAPMAAVAQVANEVFTFLFVTAVFVMIYKWMPRVRVAWRDVWFGAVVTAVLFTLGKGLIGLYIGRSGVASAFGAAASLVVLLVWVYWSAQIFLLGAEFTWVFAHRHGSMRGREPPAPPVPASPNELEEAREQADAQKVREEAAQATAAKD